MSNATISKHDRVTVTVDIINTGKRVGDEVVQLYVHEKVSSVTRPIKELKGFQRITVKPGKRQRVTFTLTPDELSFYNRDMKRVVEPGDFDIMIGPNSMDLIKLSVFFNNQAQGVGKFVTAVH